MSLNDQMRDQCLEFCNSCGVTFENPVSLTSELKLIRWYDGSGYTIYEGDYKGDNHRRIAEISETSRITFIHIAYSIFVATHNIPLGEKGDSPLVP